MLYCSQGKLTDGVPAAEEKKEEQNEHAESAGHCSRISRRRRATARERSTPVGHLLLLRPAGRGAMAEVRPGAKARYPNGPRGAVGDPLGVIPGAAETRRSAMNSVNEMLPILTPLIQGLAL